MMSTSLVAISCSPSAVDSPPSRTLREFCEPLRDTLSDEHIVQDALVEAPQSTLDKQVKAISDEQLLCYYTPSDSDGVRATSILSPVTEEFDFDEINKFLTSDLRGYVRLDGHPSPIWLKDYRQIDEKFQVSSGADLTTTIGKWQGSIEIDGGRKPLPMSDAQISQLADALIAVTKRMNETPTPS